MEERTRMLGSYEIGAEIGRGGFCTVLEGTHTQLGRKAAIRVLNDRSQRERMKLEAKVLGQVGDHPNIVEIYDADFLEETAYVAVELCDGSLKNELNNGARLGWKRAVEISQKILGATAYAHAREIVHGDIKPSNILFSNGEPKLSDFNLAAVANPQDLLQNQMVNSASLQRFDEQRGGLEGTLLYLAPEQKKGESPSKKTDIFQHGVILYEMLTGKPFVDRELTGHERPDYPLWLNDVVNRATRANPDSRFSSAEEMRAALCQGLEGKFDAEPFSSKASSLLNKIRGGVLTALKYTGLGVTAPFWGPIALIKKYDEFDSSTDWALFTGIASAIAVYLAAPIVGFNLYESHREQQTRAEFSKYLESAPKDLQLGYLSGSDKFYVVPVSELVKDQPKTTEIHLSVPLEKLLGIAEGTLYYTGKEIRQNGNEKEEYPQVYTLNLQTNHTEPIIQYDNQDERWTKGKTFSEVKFISGSQQPYALVEIENYWYNLSQGKINKQERVTLPFENVNRKLPNSDFIFETSGGGYIQYFHEDHFWGDVELFKGKDPIIFQIAVEDNKR